MFVLKRLSDALAHGDAIHAIVAGVGLSNDMHGNLLAPAKEGQLRAMRHAYERAGWKPQDVDLIECHATGTEVGDAVEFDSLRELWGESGWEPGRCAIGSVKSTVGHLLTGAGAAAVMKTLLAMKAGVLPPQANFAQPAAGLRYAGSPFRVLARPEPWEPCNGARARSVCFGSAASTRLCWKSGATLTRTLFRRLRGKWTVPSRSSAWLRDSAYGTTRGSSRNTFSVARPCTDAERKRLATRQRARPGRIRN